MGRYEKSLLGIAMHFNVSLLLIALEYHTWYHIKKHYLGLFVSGLED